MGGEEKESGYEGESGLTARPDTHAPLRLSDGGGTVSDGREEREERERRIEEQTRKDREDWVNRDEPDEWKPERVDS